MPQAMHVLYCAISDMQWHRAPAASILEPLSIIGIIQQWQVDLVLTSCRPALSVVLYQPLQWYGWPMLSIAAVETFFSAITFALTLMLVFKTNSSYSRWWEARSKVGMLTSTAHDLARAVRTHTGAYRARECILPGKTGKIHTAVDSSGFAEATFWCPAQQHVHACICNSSPAQFSSTLGCVLLCACRLWHTSHPISPT
jgi:hypothetical protein